MMANQVSLNLRHVPPNGILGRPDWPIDERQMNTINLCPIDGSLPTPSHTDRAKEVKTTARTQELINGC